MKYRSGKAGLPDINVRIYIIHISIIFTDLI